LFNYQQKIVGATFWGRPVYLLFILSVSNVSVTNRAGRLSFSSRISFCRFSTTSTDCENVRLYQHDVALYGWPWVRRQTAETLTLTTTPEAGRRWCIELWPSSASTSGSGGRQDRVSVTRSADD